ncbi:ATP-binding protein [Deinococcus yavapaiensis]|uniref:histidine kinase n=1 Tax=Deinococcus yavapaiensis KR-236 TaxID=694435 RepID=A0A318S910_9DEIO|nr:ATP-binding protein [Deinococcus yavapaiensis]PYE52916.1 GAF domain-containing protein [Deinococcus yavapaiensis KR-236]
MSSTPPYPQPHGDDPHSLALEAFVQLSEAVGLQTDVHALARQAIHVLCTHFPGGSAAYYERDGNLWKMRVWSDDLGEDIVRQLTEGVTDRLPGIAAVLRERQAVFADVWNPEAQQIRGSESYDMAASVPLIVAGQVRGVLGLGVRGSQAWQEHDKALVRAVGRSLTLALERAYHVQALDEERLALATFVTYTEAVGTEMDVDSVAQHAMTVLSARFPHGSCAYYELDGQVWRARAWTGDMRSDVLAMIQAGVPADLPLFARASQAKAPLFVDAWNSREEGVEVTDEYGAGAAYPLVHEQHVTGLLAVGLRDTREWSERDKALVRAVGRSLTLALERAKQAETLKSQASELEARTKALEGFAQLTRDLSLNTDPYALVRRAQQLAVTLLPDGFALYYEPEGSLWRLKAQVGSLGSSSLQAIIDRGLSFEETRNLLLPWTRQEPYYQDAYDHATDGVAHLTASVQSTACLPVLVAGEPRGVFAFALNRARVWSRVDKVTLESVVHNLGLALERTQSLAELAEERRKLAAANEELEAFSYSVSHDLRTPVRHITSFAGLLRNSLRGQGDDKTERYLDVIDQAVRRMDTLIEAMLNLARTSRLPLRLVVVDLDALVAAVRADLEMEFVDRDVEWLVQPLPLVMGDHDTLRLVLMNLLSNALKYTRDKSVARIEVWAQDAAGESRVFVRDNGAGFDPQYGHKLFSVFQRLHRAEEFEGVGVGLANVRRIVERHGGRVWAEGRPSRGATFGFSLPKHR